MLLTPAQLVLLGVALLLAGCSPQTDSPQQPPADLVLGNGKIYTVDAELSWAQAVAVRDGRIAYVGSNEGVADYRGPNTREVDLRGKMVLPGFQDVHIHPVSGGIAYLGCPLFELESLDQVVAKITECARDNPQAAYIRGRGWNWGTFIDEAAPHKQLLDEIDRDRPLIFGDSDGHTLWVNSAALELAGISRDTPDPDGGEIGRDEATGEPSGTLLEGPAMELLNNALPPATLAEKVDALRYAQDYLHSIGITAMQDAYVRLRGNEADKSLDAYAALRDSGELQLRVVAALYWEPGEGMEQIEEMLAAREKYSGGRLQVTAIKFWADGILETHTARLLEPYSDQPDTRGLLMVPREEMMAAASRLDAAGFQIHIHAIGDGTVRYALDALEGARQANGPRDSRHLTAHTQLVHPDDIGRFAELDVIAGFSPYWAYADEYVATINPPQIGEQRMGWMYPIKAIQDAGARVAFGSDWYVSTADPLLAIETAVTRQSPHGEATPVFLPAQRISLPEAIAGYTINAAFANFLDEDTGSVEVGKYADLVVLSDNLFDIPVDKISDAKVVATLFEGRLVYGSLDK